ncbi:1,4-alpha-glucan branching protein GlgB [Dongia deserti]|uniref:1,4-alpha-glucan branching protein GlgB n=1 Tax=Dongia deserti TaxID=2268030 RepID=UPI000E645F8F|nr:1,4-alpha-glucan branching protein GlgB [Dongia deserti]
MAQRSKNPRQATSTRGRHARRETDLHALASALAGGDCGDPFSVLGLHAEKPDQFVVRCYHPAASQAWVIDRAGGEITKLEQQYEPGFFAGPVPGRINYRLRLALPVRTIELEDPYRFPPVLGDIDMHLLAEGTHLRLYERLGAQLIEIDGIKGVSFAVWAPNARRVSVIGDFNDWDGRRHPMRKRFEAGVWELFLPELKGGELYKYEVKSADGRLLPLKADPVSFQSERPPRTASVVHGAKKHEWNDASWMSGRESTSSRSAPISIYECHLGSWARVPEENNRYLTYEELGERLVPYVKQMGFTHLELLPISEYPFDGSWGYQPIALYAPTSRHGSPVEFARFMDRCHQEGLGVILDWVPGHFPTDAHGLVYFDGTHLYEHSDPRLGMHQDWNTLIYNYGRHEVTNYLLANALFWLDRYHIDGLRVDAVASMLYLDYSRKPDQWIPNRYGGNENLEATAFLRRLNELAYGHHPGVMTIAEESTAWPAVSRPTYVGGLGFGYKWNMGWMHDTLRYIGKEPVHRPWHHNDLSFGLLYAFSENFILPISHDEVVHGKGSLIGRMPGDSWQRFANLRAYLGFMFTHPGKKLLFMGCEFGQEREWNHDAGLDWHLLSDADHSGAQTLVRDLNAIYRTLPALHQLDCEPQGFEWIDASDHERSIISYLRRGKAPESLAVIVCNFTPVPRHHCRIGVPEPGFYAERINTDSAFYGGSNVGNGSGVLAEPQGWHGRPYSIELTLPPLGTLILERKNA